MRRRLLFAAVLAVIAASGFLVAGTFPTAAHAWNWQSLPNGYGIRDVVLPGSCHDITLNGTHIGSDCDPGFQDALDAYINGSICTVNPAADQPLCAPPPPATTTVATTTTASTTTVQTPPATTTTQAPPATTTTQTPPPASTPPPATTTDPVTTTAAAATPAIATTAPVTTQTLTFALDQRTIAGALTSYVHARTAKIAAVKITAATVFKLHGRTVTATAAAAALKTKRHVTVTGSVRLGVLVASRVTLG